MTNPKFDHGDLYGRESQNMRLVGHSDLGGRGDAGQVLVQNDVAYIGHMGLNGLGTSIVDVADPTAPQVLTQLAVPSGTHSHKVQVVEDVLLVNYEQNRFEPGASMWEAGLKIYDVSDPLRPKAIGFFEVFGKGVHRMTCWQLPYVYLSASAEGYSEQIFMIIDLSDPSRPKEVSRWWLPGMGCESGPIHSNPARKYTHHHPIIRSDRAYCTWWDAGLVILDIADLTNPKLIHHLPLDPASSSATHTALPVPGRDILILVDEAIKSDDPLRSRKHARVIDISNEHAPFEVARFPIPEGDYRRRGGTFGPHNVHEMRPGSLISSNVIHLTYNNAGIRVVDIADPEHPNEVAYFVPADPSDQPIQINDVYVDEDGLVFMTDKISGGLYIVEHTAS